MVQSIMGLISFNNMSNSVGNSQFKKKPENSVITKASQASCRVCKGDCGDYSDVKNHYPRYDIAPKECLVSVPKELKGFKTRNIEMFLKPEVLQKFKEMSEAYKRTHKNQPLLLNAGFRNEKDQALMVSLHPGLAAPVGYTEHHTGCAVDIKDATVGSERFNWLMKHAKEYGFELSYPQNNPQGATPETWHWRYNEDLPKQKK